MEIGGGEGLLMALGLLILPLIFLAILLKIFPAWPPLQRNVAGEITD
jgi:hypothetical protein